MFMDSSTQALTSLFVATVFGALYLGPVIAITHTLVNPNMRAMSSAILFLVLNLIGLGCGPLAVGLISDALTPSLGSDALRYAIAGVSFVGLFSMLAFYRGAKYLPADLAGQQAKAC